jgi:hypothetical protein
MRRFFGVFTCLALPLLAMTEAELNQRISRYERLLTAAEELDDQAEVQRLGKLIEQIHEGLEMLQRESDVKATMADTQQNLRTEDAIQKRQLLIDLEAQQYELDRLAERKLRYWEWVLAGEEGHEHLDKITKDYEQYRYVSGLEVSSSNYRAASENLGVRVAAIRRHSNVRINQSTRMVQDNRALLKLLALWKKLSQMLEAEERDEQAILVLKTKIAQAEVSRKVRSEMTRIRNEHRRLRDEVQAYGAAKITNKHTAAIAKQLDEMKMQEFEQKELVTLWEAVLEAEEPEDYEAARQAYEAQNKRVARQRSVREIRKEIAQAEAAGDSGAVESLKESLKEYQPPAEESLPLPPAPPPESEPDSAPAPTPAE